MPTLVSLPETGQVKPGRIRLPRQLRLGVQMIAASFMVWLLLPQPVQAGEHLLRIHSRGDVIQRALFIEADNPTHTILLFSGGGGWIKLKDDGKIRKGKNNFVIRTRQQFIDAGMNVVIVDAPSDHYDANGLRGGFRNSPDHITDLTALLKTVKAHNPQPVWLSGTSRGSESVAYAGIHLPGIAGIILTSSVTETNRWGEPVTRYELDKITIPVFIGAHEDDECSVTPPSGATAIRERLTASPAVLLKRYRGGDSPVSGPCKARSQHGFYGIENEVIRDIIAFVRSH